MKQAMKVLDILVLCVVLALMLCACISGTQGAPIAATQPTTSVAEKTEPTSTHSAEIRPGQINATAESLTKPTAVDETGNHPNESPSPSASVTPTDGVDAKTSAKKDAEPSAVLGNETNTAETDNQNQDVAVLTEDAPPYQHMYVFKPSPITAPTISPSENSELEDIKLDALENQRINIMLLLAVVAVIEMLIILFMAVVLFKSRRKKPEDEDRVIKDDSHSAPIQNDQLSHEDVKTMIETALKKQKPVPLTKLYKEDEVFMALITLSEKDKLRLELEKDGDVFVLKRKEPEQVTQNVIMEVEGIYTDKLTPTDKKTRFVVTYEPDSIWAYLDLDYETLTEVGVKGDKLERFFGFTSIPPAPSAFEIKVVKKAKLTRKGQDFFLVEKGEVEVNK